MNIAKPKTPGFARRPLVIMAGITIGAATLIVANQTWIEVQPTGQIVQTPFIHVSGADVSTLVSALTLVALAGSAALSLAGKWAARIIGFLIVLVGISNIANISAALADVTGAASSAVSEATGVPAVQGDYSFTLAPTITMVLSGLLVLVGVWILVVHRWWKRQRKYDSTPTSAQEVNQKDVSEGKHLDEIDAWDAISASEDPTIK